MKQRRRALTLLVAWGALDGCSKPPVAAGSTQGSPAPKIESPLDSGPADDGARSKASTKKGISARLGQPTASDVHTLVPGDIVFQTSPSSQSQAIQKATRSSLSHVGIVLSHQGKLSVYEAVGPVKFTALDSWVARGTDGHVLAKRLRPPLGPLAQEKVAAIAREAETFRGRPYDLAFDWSDDRLYCSELVWKVYQRGLGIELGSLHPLRDFDLSAPEVQAKLHDRFGPTIPLDEPMIAPAAIADSPLLETVLQL